MKLRNRPLARLGAAVLLASAALTLSATPAHAETPEFDIAVDVVGTRVAAGSTEKIAVVKISNLGATTPEGIEVDYEVHEFDASKVRINPLLEGCDQDRDEEKQWWNCGLGGEQIPGPGQTIELPLLVLKPTDALTEPYRASLLVEVQPWVDGRRATDTDPENNQDRVDVELTPESGVDLGVVVPDVTEEISFDDVLDENPKTGPLNPGDKTVVFAFIQNQGDRIADGFDLSISLPRGVTFDDSIPLQECEYAADLRSADCEAGLFQLAPGEDIFGVFPVTVASGVDAPVTLSGGTVTVSARGELPATEENLASRKGAALPSFLRRPAGARSAQAQDVDPSDNSDRFAVVVTAAPANGGGGGGDGDGDGGLPVTGPQAGLIGGIGAAVVAAGAALFLLARRRRVLLVNPGDEKSTA